MRRDGWLTLMVAVVAVVVQLPIYDRWLGLLDEGYVLGIADQINVGKVLYRDIVVDAPFPGAFYLLAWWFRLVGTSVVASRLLVMMGFAAYAATTFYVARTVLPRHWALALVSLLLCHRIWAFPHWHMYSYSTLALVLIAGAVVSMMRFIDTPKHWRLALAGLLTGLAVATKQDYGAAALIAMPGGSAVADQASADHAAAVCSAAQAPKTTHAGTSATSRPTTTGTSMRMRERGNIST